jgi:hypothetical protein
LVAFFYFQKCPKTAGDKGMLQENEKPVATNDGQILARTLQKEINPKETDHHELFYNKSK